MEGVQAAIETPALQPGERVQQLRVVRLLGAGLHGEVYLVEHQLTGEPFALKVMHLEDVGQASLVRRAISAAKATYAIRHANVVSVRDLGCEDDGKVWVLMEYLDGASIREVLWRQRGRLSLRLAFHIALEAAWGIDAAHELGIIHRDIKPENVWLTAAGVVKVIDFSLAKVIPEGVKTTQRKTAVGTAPYMAPEALRGDDPDARMDIYALCLMLWEMLGSRHPWQDVLRDTAEMVRRQLYETVPSIVATSGLPAYVDEFFARGLAKNPNARFMTIAETAQALMSLRDRLLADVDRGLIMEDLRPGEPRIATDPRSRRAYEGAVMPPTAEHVPVSPTARVMVGSTMRMAPSIGVGGTIPLGAYHAGRVAQPAPMGAVLPSSPSARSEAPTPIATAPRAAAPPSSTPEAAPAAEGKPPAASDAAEAVLRSTPSTTGTPQSPSRKRVGIMALALATSVCTSVGVLAWVSRHAALPPQPSVSATAAIPPPIASTGLAPDLPAASVAKAPAEPTPAPAATAPSATFPVADTRPSSRADAPPAPSASHPPTRANQSAKPKPPAPPPVTSAPVAAPKLPARNRPFDTE